MSSGSVTTVTVSTTALSITLGVTFTLGMICGYQLKKWRIEWLKRRHDRLQRKIKETQAELDGLQKGH